LSATNNDRVIPFLFHSLYAAAAAAAINHNSSSISSRRTTPADLPNISAVFVSQRRLSMATVVEKKVLMHIVWNRMLLS
jgi:hypothetical protein